MNRQPATASASVSAVETEANKSTPGRTEPPTLGTTSARPVWRASRFAKGT